MRQGGGDLFLIAQMSQNSIDDVLVLDTPVRRIGNDPDGTTAVTTRQRLQTSMSILKTRLSRWAQVMAA